jgi:hypothetical protein
MDDDFKELYVPDAEAIPEKDIRWWSRYMSRRKFQTEAEAREEIFRILQHNDTQSWAHIFGPQGEPKNRWEADNMPLYQNKWGHWKVGRPLSHYRRLELPGDAEERERQKQVQQILRQHQLREYLSNNTSDFSDGTNGEPSAQASFAGDGGTNVGLPDYKYAERKERRHAKLRALIKRRDPTHRSNVDWDVRARAGMRESEEEDMMKEVSEPPPTLQAVPTHRTEEYLVTRYDGQHLGAIFLEPEEHMPKVPVLLKLHQMYPWVAWWGMETARFKTKEQAVAHLVAIAKGEFPDKHHPDRQGRAYMQSMRNRALGEMPREVEEAHEELADAGAYPDNPFSTWMTLDHTNPDGEAVYEATHEVRVNGAPYYASAKITIGLPGGHCWLYTHWAFEDFDRWTDIPRGGMNQQPYCPTMEDLQALSDDLQAFLKSVETRDEEQVRAANDLIGSKIYSGRRTGYSKGVVESHAAEIVKNLLEA